VLATMGIAAAVVAWRLWSERRFLDIANLHSDEAIRGTAFLLLHPLRIVVERKRIWAIAAAFALPLLVLGLLLSCGDNPPLRALIAGICLLRLLLVLCAELAERYLFFAAITAPRMPGGLA
jgi:formate dehydrogenase iron-sulfur subunit